jgi:hypothetical protein
MTRPDSIMHVPQLFFGVSAMGRLLLDQVRFLVSFCTFLKNQYSIFSTFDSRIRIHVFHDQNLNLSYSWYKKLYIFLRPP